MGSHYCALQSDVAICQTGIYCADIQNKLELKSQSRFLDSILVFSDRSSVLTHCEVMGWGGFKKWALYVLAKVW